MGLITVDDVEIAVGRPITGAEADQVQYYIDAWSAYIKVYTGTSFTLHTDEVVRLQADYYGLIDFQFGPVTDVSDISTPDGQTLYYAAWDFLNTIYGLPPHKVVDVTMTYGYEEAPADIASVATQLVVQTMANPDGLTSYRVGDVTEGYGGLKPGGSPSFQSMVGVVLDSYRTTETTWRIGPRQFPGPPFLLL